jgi:chromosome partitioning protein
MKKIISICNSKGGAGKTTILLNLAIALNEKYKVTVLDLDFQKSSMVFNNIRKENKRSLLNIIQAESEKDLKKAIKENTGILLIDTGAYDSDLNRMAILLSDMIISPVCDNSIDIYGILMFNEYLKKLKAAKPSLKTNILINRLSAKGSTKEIINQVKENKNTMVLMKSILKDRQAYKNLFITGESVIEAKRKNEATAEILKLMAEVIK